MYGFDRLIFFCHILSYPFFTRVVQFELVFFSSTKCALDYNKKVSFLYLLPSFPFTFLGFFVCFCLSFLLLNFAFGRIKQLHFDFLRSVIYTWKRSISNQLALTNLHLSVFFSFFFFKNLEEATRGGGEDVQLCVCVLVCLRRYIDFGRILRHDFFMPSCLNKLLASTVQRAIEVGHENLFVLFEQPNSGTFVQAWGKRAQKHEARTYDRETFSSTHTKKVGEDWTRCVTGLWDRDSKNTEK